MILDKIDFIMTGDGSHTLYVEELNETYHSRHGAIQEALHVFINAGLGHLNQKKISVLEIGFGTGLNTFLTLLESQKQNIEINYTSIETFPLIEKLTKQLNFMDELNSNKVESNWFNKIHSSEWGDYQEINKIFRLNKINVDLVSYRTTEQFNVIYFDAFAPQVQPEMWTTNIFEEMYKCLLKGGALVTYCAKGNVKRSLKEVGFKIETLPGPPGKREMTRAIKL